MTPFIRHGDTRWRTTINIFMVFLVLLSVVLTIVESIPSIMTPQLRGIFLSTHITILIVFLIEFLYRCWSAPHTYPHMSPMRARLRWGVSFFTVIDIIVIAPLFIMLWTHDLHDADFVILRILRFTSLLNIFRFYRDSRLIKLLTNLGKEIWYEMVIFLIISFQCIVVAGALFYIVEYTVNPKVHSMLDGIWWAIVTLTTIGYGDIYPMTGAGRIIATVLGLVGIGLVALPTGILASGFIRAIRQDKKLEKLEEEIEEEQESIEQRLKRIEKLLREQA